MNNTEIWDALKRPPKSALRQIGAGRLKGKSDISPQWRLHAMTERFGPVGIGWRYEIIRQWSEEAGDERFAFVEVNLYVRVDGEWSAAIPGVGGSKLMQMERNGIYANDEGYKMALTDALGVAMKSLGVAADIYLGLFDGSKYLDEDDEQLQSRTEQPPQKSEDEVLAAAKRKTLALLEADHLDPAWVEEQKASVEAFTKISSLREKYKDIEDQVKQSKLLEEGAL